MSGPELKPAPLEVSFPLSMFSLEAIKRAAYALMARATVEFETTPAKVRCILVPTSLVEEPEALERDFRREIVDQDLRISIEAQTEPMRNAILGLTFSRTGLQE